MVALKVMPWHRLSSSQDGDHSLQLISEEFERTPEQNEELGLNDMDTKEADKAYEVTTMA
jgi:hypothetical protein